MKYLTPIQELEERLANYRELLARPGQVAQMSFAGADEVLGGARRVVVDLLIARRKPITRAAPEPKKPRAAEEILKELGY